MIKFYVLLYAESELSGHPALSHKICQEKIKNGRHKELSFLENGGLNFQSNYRETASKSLLISFGL